MDTDSHPTLPVSDAVRFQTDLEFLQLLSNPSYLNYLAVGGFFEDLKFLNYLRYLQYWKQPRYAKYILFPASLGILDALVSSKQLRDDLKFLPVIEKLRQQLWYHWMSGPLYDNDKGFGNATTIKVDGENITGDI